MPPPPLAGLNRLHLSTASELLCSFAFFPFSMQVTGQQQEMAILDRQLGHKKEELHLLQGSMVQAKADLQEALRLGETEVTEKCNHIRVCFSAGFLQSPRTVL